MEFEAKGLDCGSGKKLYVVEIKSPPRFVTIGTKRHYLTNQVFYSGVHWAIRKKLVEEVKGYVGVWLGKVDKMASCELAFYFGGKMGDLDNRGFFWTKMVQDWLVGHGRLQDDSVRYVSGLGYRWIGGDEDFMKIVIKYVDVV